MSYILTNPSALSALQSLQQTQSNLATVQNQVSTGLSVSDAKDNASYWSIATQLTSDSGVITAANSALSQSQSVLDTASSAISSVISTIGSIQTALTQAAGVNTPASLATINTTLQGLGKELTDAINGASFNGLNVLNGSQTGALSFVAGFNATAAGGTFSTISLTTQALTGTAGTTTTTAGATVTDAATINQIISLATTTGPLAYGTNVTTATAGTTAVYATTQDTAGTSSSLATGGTGAITTAATQGTVSIQSEALDGTTTTTTYSAFDANGNTTSLADAASLQVSVTTTTPAGLLTQGGIDLTTLGTGANTVTSANANSLLAATATALTAVTSYGATIGAAQDRITNATNLNSQLTTNYATGVAGLVDANMNTASTQLQALQTQEQLGIQALSIANQNSQLILKLFNG